MARKRNWRKRGPVLGVRATSGGSDPGRPWTGEEDVRVRLASAAVEHVRDRRLGLFRMLAADLDRTHDAVRARASRLARRARA